MIEGYPAEATGNLPPEWDAYLGTPSAFKKAGFKEVLRRSKRQPIMRLELPRS